MSNLAASIPRATLRSLLSGYGARKLFGSFSGPALEVCQEGLLCSVSRSL